MPFWMCLVHHGARVGGLREMDQFSLEKVSQHGCGTEVQSFRLRGGGVVGE